MSIPLYPPSGPRLWVQPLARWLLAALVLATLAPGISRALAGSAPSDGARWVELCTSQGMQWVQVGEENVDAETAPDGERPLALDLCGHCTLAAERFAPLLPIWPVPAVVVASWSTPVFSSTDFRSAEAPRAAARGPPLRS
jgi:hypothetical protein